VALPDQVWAEFHHSAGARVNASKTIGTLVRASTVADTRKLLAVAATTAADAGIAAITHSTSTNIDKRQATRRLNLSVIVPPSIVISAERTEPPAIVILSTPIRVSAKAPLANSISV
jgi:hypothetical protein